ncbi:MAG: hypothetical protein ACD_11C00062G0002 [uncultured bacterium]|nr:MAG: hypothetical protein ACD_11C00062G0002 [uncultured bacterium]
MYTFLKKNIIILSLGIFMLSSLFYLALIERKQQDPNYGKDWWALYFENPKSNSLDFTIENHSGVESFQWEVYLEKSKTYEGNSELPKGETKTIPVSATDLADKKVTVKVFSGEKTQEIYKIITN